MIGKIIKFQMKEQFRHWISLVFFLMLIFQGIWYTKGSFDYFVNDGVLMNAPSIFYRNFSGLGMLMVIMITVLTGGFLFKDIQHKTAGWIYTFPMSEKKFFVGRFLAAYLINLILAMGFFVGMLLVPYSGIGEAHRFGPAPIGQMLHGVLVFLMPNVLLFTSVIICTLVYTKKMAASYLAAFSIMIIFVIMESTSSESGYTPIILLSDPNGYVTITAYIKGLTTFEKNHAYLQVSGYLLTNRLIWFGVSLTLFALAYRKFSFMDFIDAGSKKSKHVKEKVSTKVTSWTTKIPVPKLSFSVGEQIKKSISLSSLEFRNIVRPTSFRVILGVLSLMIVLQNLMWNASYYIGPEVPLTSNMTYFRLPWGVIITLLLMIWSGELFFKDKTINIWQITDALPVPVWVSQLSRLIAMIGVAFILCMLFIVIGMLCQIMLGGTSQIDLNLYAGDVLGYKWGWLTFVSEICLVFFIGGLTGRRVTTHILSVGIYLITIISADMGLFEQVRYLFPLTPGVDDYSEISGYGILSASGFWVFLLWTCLSVVFVLLGILFWDRGVASKWYLKLKFKSKQLNGYGKLAVVLFLIAFLALQGFIDKEMYSNGNFKTTAESDFEAANYEIKYKSLESVTQPKYKEIDLAFEYFPEERKATYKAVLTLENPSSDPIKKLYLNFKDFMTIRSVKDQEGNLKELSNDTVHHLITYQLSSPLDSGATMNLMIEAEKKYVGFTQGGDHLQTDIVFNGSFGKIQEFLPVIGYDSDKELDINRDRQDNKLDKLNARMAAVSDARALMRDAYATDASWVHGKITIGTSIDQTVLAPGNLVKQWTENDRNYFEYEVKNPTPYNWCIGSARYLVHSEGKVGKTQFQILADKKHDFNVSIYTDAIRKGITFINDNLREYPYQELTLAEINRYHDARYTFPNVMAISEKEGWVADTTGINERAYLYLTIVSELSKHWVNQQMHIADVQGANMLKVALPEALALKFVQRTLGEKAVGALIEKKLEVYGKDHNNEPNTEPALVYADGADYLEINKGAIAIYKCINKIGLDSFVKTLQQWIAEKPGENRVFKALYDQLKMQLTPADQKEVINQFEKKPA